MIVVKKVAKSEVSQRLKVFLDDKMQKQKMTGRQRHRVGGVLLSLVCLQHMARN